MLAHKKTFHKSQPFILMFFAIALFAIYDGTSALIDENIKLYEIIFLRSVVSLIAVIFYEVYVSGGVLNFVNRYTKLRFPLWHLIQGMTFLISSIAFLKAFEKGGFLISYVVSFSNTAWIIFLGVIIIGRSLPSWRICVAIFGAFIGGVIIIASRSNSAMGEAFIVAGLIAGAAYGAELVFSEKAKIEHNTSAREVVFYAILTSAAASLIYYIFEKGYSYLDSGRIYLSFTGLISVLATYTIFYAIEQGNKQIPKIGSDKLGAIDYTILIFGLLSDICLCFIAVKEKFCDRIYNTNWFVFGVGFIVLIACITALVILSVSKDSE